MRLRQDEIDAIKICARQAFGPDAVVRLFGSRVRDDLRGGDIDLHIEVGPMGRADLRAELEFLTRLKARIGECRIDRRGQASRRRTVRDRRDRTPRGRGPVNPTPRERTAKLFLDNFAAAHASASAERLAWSLDRLAPLFPIGAERIARLQAEQEEALDTLLHRFTNLLSMVQGRFFRGVALLEEEDLTGRSKRDLTDLMERWGMIPTGERFSAIAELPNRLTHDYPT